MVNRSISINKETSSIVPIPTEKLFLGNIIIDEEVPSTISTTTVSTSATTITTAISSTSALITNPATTEGTSGTILQLVEPGGQLIGISALNGKVEVLI